MALDLEELHKKEKSRLRTPKVSQRKTMMPWDKHSDAQVPQVEIPVSSTTVAKPDTKLDIRTELKVESKVESKNEIKPESRIDTKSKEQKHRDDILSMGNQPAYLDDPKMVSVDHAIDGLQKPILLSVRYIQLKGIQRKLTYYIYQSCKKHNNLVSEEISVELLSDCSKTSLWSVKKSILRLMEKGVMSKHKFKNGPGGWTQYQLNQDIYDEIAQLERYWRSEGEQR
jgi:hypothetical protein